MSQTFRLATLEPWARVVFDRGVEWLAQLEREGLVKVRVTTAGLALFARDGMLRVDGVDHLVECEVVQLRARGARRKGGCTCGSAAS